MAKIRGPLRALHLAAVLAAASASSIRPNWMFERDEICAPDFTKCSQAGLPDNFCCDAKTTCLVLAGSTTVLCCPKGSNCNTINTITCKLSLQDPAANPAAQIKTTVLDGKLETCGTGCCPFGYHCNNGDCLIDEDQSKKPGDAEPSPTTKPHAPTTSATKEPSSTKTTSAAIGDITSAAPSTEKPEPTAANNMNTAAIVGGAVGGIVALVGIIAAVMLLRHRRKQKYSKRHDSTSSFGNIISAPVPHNDYPSQRLDFLAKAQTSSMASTPTQPQERFAPNSPYSPYSGRPDSEMSDAPRSYHPSAEVGGLRSLTDSRYSAGRPITPRDRRQHSAGSESINVYVDASTAGSIRDRRDTTWTDIQQHADTTIPDSPLRRR